MAEAALAAISEVARCNWGNACCSFLAESSRVRAARSRSKDSCDRPRTGDGEVRRPLPFSWSWVLARPAAAAATAAPATDGWPIVVVFVREGGLKAAAAPVNAGDASLAASPLAINAALVGLGATGGRPACLSLIH